MTDEIKYYQKRAPSYDEVYNKPERQLDLRKIGGYLQDLFLHKSVCEIACGTGYWTKIISETAKSILASDINREVLDIAKRRDFLNSKVIFQVEDIRDLYKKKGHYDSLFGGFILSHIRNEYLEEFLSAAINQVKEEGAIVFLDNRYVEGSSTPISRTDSNRNTYQMRGLKSGETFEIVKNFDVINEIREFISGRIEYIEYQYYWIMIIQK